MAFISEIHYKDSYRPDIPGNPTDGPYHTEYVEIALYPKESVHPEKYTVSLYDPDGTVIREVTLDAADAVNIDPDTGLHVYRINWQFSDPDTDASDVFNGAEAIALVDNSDSANPNQVAGFYDIGGGTKNITAVEGAAAGATSTNIPGSPGNNTTIQFNASGTRIDGPATPGRAATCFGAGSLIDTVEGEVPVESLQIGDMVHTRDSGPLPIRWIGMRTLSESDLKANPKLRPIRIKAGALGPGMPSTDLIVSPQHRILVRSAITMDMFGNSEVLVPAKHLCGMDGIDIADDLKKIDYVHFLFDSHQIIYANGAETESLFLGAEAIKSMPREAVEEIFTIFPELNQKDPAGRSAGVRIFLNGKQGRELSEHHRLQGHDLVMTS